jgi:hypothetical protein
MTEKCCQRISEFGAVPVLEKLTRSTNKDLKSKASAVLSNLGDKKFH